MDRATLFVGAIAFLGATAVVGYIAVFRTGDPAVTALGALIALTSAGAGFFLRGRVQSPAEEVPVPPSAGPPKPPEPKP